MGNEFRLGFPVEGRRLLGLMSLVFAMVLIVQYFELPYGNVSLSLLWAGKAEVESVHNFSIGNSSGGIHIGNSLDNRNLTIFNGLNSTVPSAADGVASVTEFSDGEDAKQKQTDDDIGADTDPEDESPSKDSIEQNHNSTIEKGGINDGLKPNTSEGEITSGSKFSWDGKDGELVAPTLVHDEMLDTRGSNPLVTPQPSDSSPPLTSPAGKDTNTRTSDLSFNPNISSRYKDASNTVQNDEVPGLLKTDLAPSVNYRSKTSIPNVKERSTDPGGAVVSISEMNNMLLQSLTSSHSMKPQWSSSVDQGLLRAKSLIQNAPNIQKDPSLYAPLFRNFSVFKRSYELMEQTLKVYVYKEGERPIFHQPVLKGIYASEGWFMKHLKSSKQFVTKVPKKAHLFYLPFSSRMLEETLYVPGSHSRKNMVAYLNDYLKVITRRYRFWNRTGGADHFLVACHDWAPSETKQIMARCMRALCNADVKEGFVFGKDVSLPETYVRSAQKPLRQLGGKPPSQRQILAFFAGNMHGYLRPILLKYWENKDPDMKIFGRMPKVKGQMNYIQHMKSSKYCICAKGFEVNSPRVVEAIFYNCVPVIISDNFVPPFFETLNWESFAVFVLEKDIPNLKTILLSIPENKYLQMQRSVRLVQQHFLWHTRPVKYDIFHMILHSIWYNRVFQITSR